jgi:hypothetical protein
MSTPDRLRNTKRKLTVIAASIVLMTLSGCALAPPRQEVVVQPTSRPELDASHESDGTAVWVKGRYAYVRGRYVWVPGYWRY